MLSPLLPSVVAERMRLKVRYSPGRFNENAHTRARTRSHANEGNMQSGFDRIANATRVHTHTRTYTEEDGVSLSTRCLNRASDR